MTVKELKEELEYYDDDMEVTFRNFEKIWDLKGGDE